LEESISNLNLAKLIPFPKFIKNEWSTEVRMHKNFQSSAKFSMCDAEEDMLHVFSCNSRPEKLTRAEIDHSIGIILSKRQPDFAQWWCSIINGCFIELGAEPLAGYPFG